MTKAVPGTLGVVTDHPGLTNRLNKVMVTLQPRAFVWLNGQLFWRHSVLVCDTP